MRVEAKIHSRWVTFRVLVLLTSILLFPVFGEGVAARKSRESNRKPVLTIVAQIKRADYEGNRPALKNLYEQLAPFLDDHQIDVRVRYWRGFALWRRALNGFNESVDRVELEQDLRAAVDEFDNALVRDPNFVDAKIGAGS